VLAVTMCVLLILCIGWWLWEKSHRKTHPMLGGLHEDIALPHSQEYELYHNGLSLCSKKVRACMAQLNVPYKSHHIDLIETGSYEVISRHFLKVNPSGLVPVLVHNGHPVYESHEIIAYVAARQERSGALSLLPVEERLIPQMQEWVDRASLEGDDPVTGLRDSAANCVAVLTMPLFCAGVKSIPVSRIFEGLLFHRLRFRPFLFLLLKLHGLNKMTRIKPLMNQLDRARTEMTVHLDALEVHLAQNGPFILGSQMTLADISWLVIFERLVEADWVELYFGENGELKEGGHNEMRPHLNAYWARLKETPAYTIGIEAHRLPVVAAATEMIREKKQQDPQFRERLEGGALAGSVL